MIPQTITIDGVSYVRTATTSTARKNGYEILVPKRRPRITTQTAAAKHDFAAFLRCNPELKQRWNAASV